MPKPTEFKNLAVFQKLLVGTWTNRNFPGTNAGGPASPYSYNVMPLPQDTAQPNEPIPSGKSFPGYILKNFTYHEKVKFNVGNPNAAVAIYAAAPNRGGAFTQTANALFYEQQVQFAEGPGKGDVVHVENGAWLYLVTGPQDIGPYGKGGTEPAPAGGVPPQPTQIEIAKQISVPHGNSILALGSFDSAQPGSPTVGAAPSVFPTPIGGAPAIETFPYTEMLDSQDDYQNPQPEFTLNTNLPLTNALGALNPTHYIHWQVTTQPIQLPSGPVQGQVINIPFEQQKAKVTDYHADYWLLSKDGGHAYNFLAYTQTIIMELTIGNNQYSFPHVTSNVVTRVGS